MSKIIIELELLTPLMYKETVHISSTGWGVVFEVVELYKSSGTVKNLRGALQDGRTGRKATSEDIEGAEECVLIESTEISYFVGSKVEFEGLSKFEDKQICNLMYRVKSKKSKDKTALEIISKMFNRGNMRYYVKPSNVDNETVNVFGDLYSEL